jgi:hypothetical protein
MYMRWFVSEENVWSGNMRIRGWLERNTCNSGQFSKNRLRA